MNKYNWKGMNYPSKICEQKTFEKNNPTTAPNIYYSKEREKFLVYISKINSNYEKQIILFMVPNEKIEGWHYLAVKNFI